ncbi:hypothetical protein BT96DRAFT_1018212 [Gymnopus androsaceus JB14]|uniref:F-box domain-containing protein n=1 Tax=Gymnopus androsaceus JB14 TaxID=1447944 RepID=A0A6A4HWZ3_9AGAR|nr:hypothetical protein BT96DRAFT_1018212 [Gymnopus androsaceus JB14]
MAWSNYSFQTMAHLLGSRKEQLESNSLVLPRPSGATSSGGLSTEIWRICFGFLSSQDLSQVACVCKAFCNISQPLLFAAQSIVSCHFKVTKNVIKPPQPYLNGRERKKDAVSPEKRLETATTRLAKLSSDAKLARLIQSFEFQAFKTGDARFVKYLQEAGFSPEVIGTIYPILLNTFMGSLSSFIRLH